MLSPSHIESALHELDAVVSSHSWRAGVVAHGVAFRRIAGRRRAAAVLGFGGGVSWADIAGMRLPRGVRGLPLHVESWTVPRTCFGLFGRSRARPGVGVRVRGSERLGTFGCLVRRDGRQLALTCEHVLARDLVVPPAGAVVQWRRRSGRRGWEPLGRLVEVGGIDYVRGVASVDSALLEVEGRAAAGAPGIGRPGALPMNEYEAVARRAKVRKLGFTTGLTTGRVEGILDIVVRNRDPASTLIRYPRVLEIISEFGDRLEFCDRGDSGAVIWEMEGSAPRAVGLLCSTVFQYKGYAIPIGRVLEAHGAHF